MRMLTFRRKTYHNGRVLEDITPLPLKEKIKIALLGMVGTAFAILWFFGGFIGAVVAAVNGDFISLALSILIPAYGAIYTIVMLVASLF